MVVSQDYIDSFLQCHPLDYAKEPILYPRVPYHRAYTDATIAQGYELPRFPCRRSNGEVVTAWGLRQISSGMLAYHLYASRRERRCTVRHTWSKSVGEEVTCYCGPRWLLATYYPYSMVNFIQVDIDRHSDDDTHAREIVKLLIKASTEYGFGIVWTTSPGKLNTDELCNSGAIPERSAPEQTIRHGLYAWIRLTESAYVREVVDGVKSWLCKIGLEQIVKGQEGAYLKSKKLVRLPGQLNVEVACPSSFQKVHNHDPVEAFLAFQERWACVPRLRRETVLKDRCLTNLSLCTKSSVTPPVTLSKTQIKPVSVTTSSLCTNTSVTPQGNTFDRLLQWGSKMVRDYLPEDIQGMEAALVEYAGIHLPESSGTRGDAGLLACKAKQVASYLLRTYDPRIKTRDDNGDKERFALHAEYILGHRDELIKRVPMRLREAAHRILDLLIAHHGRVAAVSIYHAHPTPICTFRNWRTIQSCWQLATIVDYKKPVHGNGTCKQWGFAHLVGGECP